MMKRKFEILEIEVVFFSQVDVIRTSQNDNLVDLPEFPENFEGNG